MYESKRMIDILCRFRSSEKKKGIQIVEVNIGRKLMKNMRKVTDVEAKKSKATEVGEYKVNVYRC